MASHHVVGGRWRVKVVTVEPDAVRFTAKPDGGDSCENCMLKFQPASVCKVAATLAVERGLPDCDEVIPWPAYDGPPESYIYVLDKSDPRQIQMELEK